MGRSSRARWILYVTLAAAYLLHNDLWLWRDPRPVLGLPVGLLYHVAYCGVVALLMALVVRYAWPAGLESDGSGPRARPGNDDSPSKRSDR